MNKPSALFVAALLAVSGAVLAQDKPQDKQKTGTLADLQASRIPEMTTKKLEELKDKSPGLKHLRITAAPPRRVTPERSPPA